MERIAATCWYVACSNDLREMANSHLRRHLALIIFVGSATVAGPAELRAQSPVAASAHARTSATEKQSVVSRPGLALPNLPDQAAMVLVGAALIVLGSIVRRSA